MVATERSFSFKLISAAQKAVVVAVHLESLDHCPVTREELRKMADSAAIQPSQLMIPKDGGIITF